MVAAANLAIVYLLSAAVAAAGPKLDLHSDELLVAVQLESGTCSCSSSGEKVQNNDWAPTGHRPPAHPTRGDGVPPPPRG